MGLVGLVKFGLKCFDGLAWPLFALGYPLCASIRAIETKSDCHTRKLVTYWVLYSFISLFEHTFVKLLECLPFWSYIKLVIICWLVIPHAAVYVYKHLVRPCLSMDLQIVINWFKKQKDLLLKREDFLAEAKRYVEHNGPEALEKLIAIKSKSTKHYLVVEESRAVAEEGEGSKCQEPSGMQKDIKTMEVTEKKEVSEAKQSKCEEPTGMQIDIKTVEVTQKIEVTEAKQSKCKEPSVMQNNIKTVEITEKKEVTEAKQSKCREPSVMQKNMEVTEKKEVTEAKQSKCLEPSVMQKDIKTVAVTGKKEVTEAKQVIAYIENRTFAPVEIKETTAAVEAGWEHPQMPAFKKVQKEWTCAICLVTRQSETTWNSHLQGRRHQELKAKNQASRSNASASKKSYLSKQEQEKCVSVNVCSRKIASQEGKKSDPPKEELEKCASSNGLKRRVIARYEIKKSNVLKEEQEKCVSNDGWDFSTSHEAKKSDPRKEELEKCESSNGLKHRIIAMYEVKKSDVLQEEQEKCVSNDGLVFGTITRKEEKVQGRQDKYVSNNGWDFSTEIKKSDPPDPPKEEMEKCASSNALKHRICCPKVWQPKKGVN